MNSITAKELRDNLEAMTKSARACEHIHVTQKSKSAFKIVGPLYTLPVVVYTSA